NTGHEGSFSTIHANDARESLTRLELMIAMGGFELPLPVIRLRDHFREQLIPTGTQDLMRRGSQGEPSSPPPAAP
ncbi:MAG: ATPase, T2SS/T4P/T4SS family, partial [Planctomyces sp.]